MPHRKGAYRIALLSVSLFVVCSTGVFALTDDIDGSIPVENDGEQKIEDRTSHERIEDVRNLEDIELHVEAHIGEIASVLHELVSDRIHLDVLYVAPTEDNPFHVYVTSGMSNLAMTVPEGLEEFERAELLIALPESWPVSKALTQDESSYWPIRWLKLMGRLPHLQDTWIGWGHTVPNANPPERIADTDFVGVIALEASWLRPEFSKLETASGDSISFYQIYPLYQEEMDLKLKKGAEEIQRRFKKSKISFVIDNNRKNVATRRTWFGW